MTILREYSRRPKTRSSKDFDEASTTLFFLIKLISLDREFTNLIAIAGNNNIIAIQRKKLSKHDELSTGRTRRFW